MTSFAYTTGNPANLTGGAAASMNDIQGPFTDLRTFLNGGSFDFTNLAATVQSDYNTLLTGSGYITSKSAGNASLISIGTGSSSPLVGDTGAWMHTFAVSLDPADFALTGRSAKYRLRVRLDCNSIAAGGNFTVALQQVATIGSGASGQPQYITGFAATAGSVLFTAPGALFGGTQTSADFNAPTVGLYSVSVTNSATMAAGSLAAFSWMVQRRTV